MHWNLRVGLPLHCQRIPLVSLGKPYMNENSCFFEEEMYPCRMGEAPVYCELPLDRTSADIVLLKAAAMSE